MTKEKRALIYSLSHPETGEIRYVGMTFGTLKNRLSAHISRARQKIDNTHKSNWIRKILRQEMRPKIEMLELAPVGKHIEREKWWIKKFGRKNLVNSTDGGEGMLGYKHTDEAKKKISKAHVGKKFSPDAVRKRSGENHYNYGKTQSVEVREKMSLAAKKRPPPSEETRRKISKSAKGRKASAETVQKVVDSRFGRKSKVGSSLYVGVSWAKRRRRWRAIIKVSKKNKHIGRFKSEVLAAQNYDLSSMIYYEGKYPINFPKLKPKYRKLIKKGITKITEELK